MNKQAFFWLSIFSIAMAFLESAVVVYLRELYYPQGFSFPLVPIDADVAKTEVIREFATMVMLLGMGVLVGRNALERFAYFIYCFAIWDIFYYIFLKLLLNWPASLFTWDVLFLIPVTWVGPVIAPIITSFTMILLAVFILHFKGKIKGAKINRFEWFLLILGAFTTILSFTADYVRFMLAQYDFSEWWGLQEAALFELSGQYVPQTFDWWIFLLAELIIIIPIASFWLRSRKQLQNNLVKTSIR